MFQLEPWKLSPANGCVADLDQIVRQAVPPSGIAKGRDLSANVNLLAAATMSLPQVQIFEHIDFGGANEITSLNWYFVGSWWNDRVSSIVVISGTWRFYEHWHYEGRYWDLGPGYYRWVGDVGIPNDVISSFQAISL